MSEPIAHLKDATRRHRELTDELRRDGFKRKGGNDYPPGDGEYFQHRDGRIIRIAWTLGDGGYRYELVPDPPPCSQCGHKPTRRLPINRPDHIMC